MSLTSKYKGLAKELYDLQLSDVDVNEILQFVHEKVETQIRQNDPEIQEMETQLRKSLDSLLHNESGYVNNLNTILKTYFYPLRSGVVKIKTTVLVTIFSNIEVIAGLHQDLLDKLTRAKECFPKIKIGEIFEESISSMQVYTQYVNNFSASLNMLNEERSRSKAFNQFLISCEESNPMPLEALLSFPLNRIPHYRGALTTILQSTARNGPDFIRLAKISEDLSNLQEYLNQSKTQSDNMAKVFNVESKIVGREYALNDIHRKFNKEGPIQVLGSDKKAKDAYAFLFNDIMVITKKIPQKTQYRYKQSYSLQYGSLMSGDGLSIELTNPTTKENLTLVATNVDSKRDWVDAIQKVLDSMERTRVFRVTVADLMAREKPGAEIPTVIADLIAHLEKHALQSAGLFRISGSSNTINSVISQFDRGIKVEISKLDNHVVSGVLKQLLRTMKEPLIPFSKFDALLECYDAENKVEALKSLLADIPEVNFTVIKRIIQMLNKVASYSTVNKMTPSNLAIVIGPNLAREEIPSTFGEINITTKVSPLVQIMMESYDEIFPKDPPPRFSKAVPRSATIIGPSKSVSSTGMLGSRRVKRDRAPLVKSDSSKPQRLPPRPPPRRGAPRQMSNTRPVTQTNVSFEEPSQPPVDVPVTSDKPITIPPEPDIAPVICETKGEDVTVELQEEGETCARCRKAIGEEFIELGENLYHPNCFLCDMCSNELTQGFFKQNGKPVCRDCRRKSRAVAKK